MPAPLRSPELAAKAIREAATGIALDPERHLVALLQGNVVTPPSEGVWHEVCEAVAQAKDQTELERGVADHAEQVIRKLNVRLAEATKRRHYEDFADKVAKVCDLTVPGFYDAFRNKTRQPKVRGKKRERVLSEFRSAPFVVSIIVGAIGSRYALVVGEPVDFRAPIANNAVTVFAAYCLVYGAYLGHLMTSGRRPEPNDWGDLELFLYAQPGSRIATADRKLLTVARLADVADQVIEVRPLPAS